MPFYLCQFGFINKPFGHVSCLQFVVKVNIILGRDKVEQIFVDFLINGLSFENFYVGLLGASLFDHYPAKILKIFHIYFFQALVDFLKSFSKVKVIDCYVWLESQKILLLKRLGGLKIHFLMN